MIKTYAAAALLLVAAPAVAGAAATQETSVAVASTTATSTIHTKRLLLHVTAGHSFDQSHFAATERVRSRATGKVVGFDTFSGHVVSDGTVFQTAFAFKGGILLTRVHSVGAAPARYAGRVIGGTGAYRGATGTVRGRAVSREDTRFNIRYQL